MFAHLEPMIKESSLGPLAKAMLESSVGVKGIMHGKELILYSGQRALAWKWHIGGTAIWKSMQRGKVLRAREIVAKDRKNADKTDNSGL